MLLIPGMECKAVMPDLLVPVALKSCGPPASTSSRTIAGLLARCNAVCPALFRASTRYAVAAVLSLYRVPPGFVEIAKRPQKIEPQLEQQKQQQQKKKVQPLFEQYVYVK